MLVSYNVRLSFPIFGFGKSIRLNKDCGLVIVDPQSLKKQNL